MRTPLSKRTRTVELSMESYCACPCSCTPNCAGGDFSRQQSSFESIQRTRESTSRSDRQRLGMR